MRRVTAIAAAAVAAATVASGAAAATNECNGLRICVPVVGPWVLASPAGEVQFQLACPQRFVVAGLDAELSVRGIDVSFRGALGTPVNPGITTSTSAVFLARLLRSAPGASFRPHIGCVPASGGGDRYPTAFHPLPPTAPLTSELPVLPGTHRFLIGCPPSRTLVSATHAIGFYTTAPPKPALTRRVTVSQALTGGRVSLTVHAGSLPGVRAIVQVDLVCAAAA